MTNAEAEKILEDAVSKLGEHFEAVQVLVSWVDEGATHFIPRGSGNWYSRQGMAKAYTDREISSETADQLALRLKLDD